MSIIITIMDYVLGLTIIVICAFFSFAVYRGIVQKTVIEEQGKYQRSIANAEARQNLRKVDGVFEMQLAKIAQSATGGEENELSQVLSMIGAMKSASGGSSSGGESISWDVMKEQLKNPAVKSIILDHRDEAMKILTEK